MLSAIFLYNQVKWMVIMYVLYHADENRFFQYCDELKLEFDHMSAKVRVCIS